MTIRYEFVKMSTVPVGTVIFCDEEIRSYPTSEPLPEHIRKEFEDTNQELAGDAEKLEKIDGITPSLAVLDLIPAVVLATLADENAQGGLPPDEGDYWVLRIAGAQL